MSTFLQGAFILLIAGLINRVLGFGYQIAMMRLIGPEGVGLFNMVSPIYIMMLVLAGAGIPLAIAKLVAAEVANNNMAGAYRIFRLSLFIALIAGVFFTLALVLSSPVLSEYFFPNPKVYYCLISLAPGILIVTLCSIFRGFFQGLQQMTPTAVSQTLEQIVRVFSGLGFAYFLLPYGVEFAAVGLSIGVVLGELTGFVLMLRIYTKYKPHLLMHAAKALKQKQDFGYIIKSVFTIAIPVTLTRIIATVLMAIQAVLIPLRLHSAGLTVSEATSAYGQFIGIADALLFIPGVLTMALATALVPAMSDALAGNNYIAARARIMDAVRLTLQVGVPAAFIFLALPNELCGVLFGYPEAGVMLKVLALSGPFLYLQQTTTGILQGLGRADAPCKNLIVASVATTIGIYYLTAMSGLGINGAAAAVGLGYIIMPVLNMLQINKMGLLALSWREDLFKPLLASLAMYLLSLQVKGVLYAYGLNASLTLIASLLVSALVYLVIMLLIGGINERDKEKFKLLYKFKR